MANQQHLALLKQGVHRWNEWRQKNPAIQPDLTGVDLNKVDLSEYNLSKANLSRVDFRGTKLYVASLKDANLCSANLSGVDLECTNLVGANLDYADLSQANLYGNTHGLKKSSLNSANLSGANFTGVYLFGVEFRGTNVSGAELSYANLSGTDLTWANFTGAKLNQVNLNAASLYQTNFSEADLRGADLMAAQLIETNFENANLSGSKVYGASVWNVNLKGADQSNLVITRDHKGEPTITVDSLNVAQFIYLLLNNQEIREVIDTLTTKVVLILGKFNDKQLPVLNAIRDELRKSENNYVPVLFDFQGSDNRNLTETVSTLAHMARFVIADITEPKAVHQELQRIVPALPSVPVQLLLNSSANVGGMIEDFFDYEWVLEEYKYDNLDHLLASFQDKVIAPAEAKAEELLRKRLSRRERRSEK